jgi:hypothetical protein
MGSTSIKGRSKNRLTVGGTWYTGTDTNGQWWLDNSYPYQNVRMKWHEEDGGPSTSRDNAVELSLDYTLQGWLIWHPPGLNTIAVPIQTWTWYAKGTATWNGTAWDPHPIKPEKKMDLDCYDTENFPQWDGLFKNSKEKNLPQ